MTNQNSLAAYSNIKPELRKQNKQIVDALKAAEHGLTREELAIVTGITENSVRPRVKTFLDDGVLIEFGKRKTKAGNNAAVLYLAERRPRTDCDSIDQALAKVALSEPWKAADARERGVWLSVWMYCIGQGSGTIPGARGWTDAQWQRDCHVTWAEVKASTNLLKVSGDDVLVACFPNDLRRG